MSYQVANASHANYNVEIFINISINCETIFGLNYQNKSEFKDSKHFMWGYNKQSFFIFRFVNSYFVASNSPCVSVLDIRMHMYVHLEIISKYTISLKLYAFSSDLFYFCSRSRQIEFRSC